MTKNLLKMAIVHEKKNYSEFIYFILKLSGTFVGQLEKNHVFTKKRQCTCRSCCCKLFINLNFKRGIRPFQTIIYKFVYNFDLTNKRSSRNHIHQRKEKRLFLQVTENNLCYPFAKREHNFFPRFQEYLGIANLFSRIVNTCSSQGTSFYSPPKHIATREVHMTLLPEDKIP